MSVKIIKVGMRVTVTFTNRHIQCLCPQYNKPVARETIMRIMQKRFTRDLQRQTNGTVLLFE